MTLRGGRGAEAADAEVTEAASLGPGRVYGSGGSEVRSNASTWEGGEVELRVSEAGKVRMSLLDLMVQARMLGASISGMRVANIYDLDDKTVMLKLQGRPWNATTRKGAGTELSAASVNDEHSSFKAQLVIESGCRIHTTSYARQLLPSPSNFVSKLRKHIRSQRIQDVEQLGSDRVLCITIGRDESLVHLIIEFYAGGNLILCDCNHTILSLLRPYTAHDGARVAPKRPYPVSLAKTLATMDGESLRQAVEGAESAAEALVLESKGGVVNSKLKRKMQLSRLLAEHVGYGPQLVEHALLCAGWDPASDARGAWKGSSSEARAALLEAFHHVDHLLEGAGKGWQMKGYLMAPRTPAGGASDEVEYSDFAPFLLRQYADAQVREYAAFDVAVDEYFARMEQNKAERAGQAGQDAAKKKADKKVSGIGERARALVDEEAICKSRAEAIVGCPEAVQAAIDLVREERAACNKWDEIEARVRARATAGDEAAGMVEGFRLDRDEVTLRIANAVCEEGGDMGISVAVHLGSSAMANARQHFKLQKVAAYKMKRTVEAAEERAAFQARGLAKQKLATGISQSGKIRMGGGVRLMRKKMWFERFFWFISSDGTLVVAGRDASQNEILVKRYMRASDIYVHADVHGGSSVLVRSTEVGGGTCVTESTIGEAAVFAVCRSSAWKAKVAAATPAYWVYAHQVSKTTQAGEYVSTGGFIIRGKKNYVPVQDTALGFGFLFRLSKATGESVGDGAENEGGQQGAAAEGKSAAAAVDEAARLDGSLQESQGKEQESEQQGSNEAKEEEGTQEPWGADTEGGGAKQSQEKEGVRDVEGIVEKRDDDELGIRRLAIHGEEYEDGCGQQGEEDERSNGGDVGGGLDGHNLLVPYPTQGDKLVFALPMCGPFSAFAKFRHKAKLVPGTTKRSRALQQAMGFFLKPPPKGMETGEERLLGREKELMVACSEAEVLTMLPSDTRVVVGNADRKGGGGKGGVVNVFGTISFKFVPLNKKKAVGAEGLQTNGGWTNKVNIVSVFSNSGWKADVTTILLPGPFCRLSSLRHRFVEVSYSLIFPGRQRAVTNSSEQRTHKVAPRGDAPRWHAQRWPPLGNRACRGLCGGSH